MNAKVDTRASSRCAGSRSRSTCTATLTISSALVIGGTLRMGCLAGGVGRSLTPQLSGSQQHHANPHAALNPSLIAFGDDQALPKASQMNGHITQPRQLSLGWGWLAFLLAAAALSGGGIGAVVDPASAMPRRARPPCRKPPPPSLSFPTPATF